MVLLIRVLASYSLIVQLQPGCFIQVPKYPVAFGEVKFRANAFFMPILQINMTEFCFYMSYRQIFCNYLK